jgi:hypothetical protein
VLLSTFPQLPVLFLRSTTARGRPALSILGAAVIQNFVVSEFGLIIVHRRGSGGLTGQFAVTHLNHPQDITPIRLLINDRLLEETTSTEQTRGQLVVNLSPLFSTSTCSLLLHSTTAYAGFLLPDTASRPRLQELLYPQPTPPDTSADNRNHV